MKTKINYLAIFIFYVIAIALRYLTNKTPLLDSVTNDFLKIILQAAGPAIGVFVCFLIFKIKPVLSLKGNYKSISFPFLLYWGLPIALILGTEYLTKGTFSIIAIFAILIYGLLEEVGWRGFLQQELKALPPLFSILIIATLWFVWHLNFDITRGNFIFFGILILGTWGIGRVADNTQSLLAVSAFHSLNNFFPQTDAIKIIILMICVSTWVITLVVRKRRLQREELTSV